MYCWGRTLILAGLVALAAGGTTATGAKGATGSEGVAARLREPIPAGRPDQALFNEAVLLYSNAARKAHGRAPLKADAGLSRAAAGHAANMARLRIHSHELPVRGQGKLAERLHRQSTAFRLAAENIAQGKVYRLLGRPIAANGSACRFTYGDTGEAVPIHSYASLAEETVRRWLRSPKHRASLLSSSFRRLGAGIGVDPGAVACGDVYMVQDFAD